MTRSYRATLVGASAIAGIALATGLAGCGGGTDGGSASVSSATAKDTLDKSVDALREALDRPGLGEVVTPWKAATKRAADASCPEGGDRWRTAASFTVADRTRDGDGAVAKLIGALPEGWEGGSYVGDLDDDPASVVPATYGSGSDAVSADIGVVPAAQGWTYVVSARSACVSG